MTADAGLTPGLPRRIGTRLGYYVPALVVLIVGLVLISTGFMMATSYR